MSRPIQFIIFLAVVLSITAGLHYYAWVRLVRDAGLNGHGRLLATATLWGLFGLMAASMPLSRLLPRAVASPLMWVVYIWMGCLLLLSLTLWGLDLLRLVLHPLVPADPERRRFLARILAGLAVSATGVLAALATGQALRPVAVRKLTVRLRRLPEELSGLRVVQPTDIHIGPTIDGAWLADVVERVNALQPDLIAITGDLVDGSVARLREHVAPLGRLRARHGVFFVTGNHEYYSGVDEWLAELARLGVRVLRNERVTIRSDRGGVLHVAGVDDHHSDRFPGHGPDLPRALASRGAHEPVLLLAHQPIAVLEAARYGVDLQLSGHTHGGQIWPWKYMVYLQQPYVSGLHTHPGTETQIYVSNGTGYWGPPMRLGAPAEITHITLVS